MEAPSYKKILSTRQQLGRMKLTTSVNWMRAARCIIRKDERSLPKARA
jgi:hypothetical protein